MKSRQLREGTLLDERYLIQEVLGQGGFGITYGAVNQRINQRVAIKELFWRDHVLREDGASDRISVISREEELDYQKLKEKFMREARILRDFAREPGVVQVLDYFEANNTAYLVMEYLEGMTFRQYLKTYGVFEPEDLFRRLLPLLDSLSRIHASGVIHRDISPDNIMVLEDGTFKLLDFGAARNYRTAAGGQYTAIARENYAPGEQFDRKGRQGPWTDIYALCATLYEGVTGSPPESAVQRMFLDELKNPSEMGAAVESSYEKIIMKGLQMSPANRYGDLEQMKKDVEDALPVLVEPDRRKRGLMAGILAGVAAACVLVGVLWYREYDRTHKFRNVTTEAFQLTAHPEMTAEEFAQAQEKVEERLADMAGEDNYLLEVQGSTVTAILPLEEFEGREIRSVLEEEFVSVNEEKPFRYEYEIQAVWEDPNTSLLAGENQCLPQEVEGKTVTQIYAFSSDLASGQMTRGEWSNLLTDLKIRLDSLDTPYAFGLLYGNETKVVLRIAAEKTGEPINTTLGQNGGMYLCGRWVCDSLLLSRYSDLQEGAGPLTVEEDGKGGYRLACGVSGEDSVNRLREIREYGLRTGEPSLYLKVIGCGYLAGGVLEDPIGEGTVRLTEIYLREGEQGGQVSPSLLEYFCALINDTYLPASLLLETRTFQDEQGKILFGAQDEDYYGVKLAASPLEENFGHLTEQMEKDGWTVTRREGQTAWISLGLPADGQLFSRGFERAAELIRQYNLAEGRGNFYLCFTEEQGNERCRILLVDSGTQRSLSARLILGGETMEPYYEGALAAWQELSLGEGIVMEEPYLSEE